MGINLSFDENFNVSQQGSYNSNKTLTQKCVTGDQMIKMFKKGYKIKIKEKNKGSFTRWCGGNVTNECIKRGKNSPNPAIRKKATFAANSRKWKHQNGGTFVYEDPYKEEKKRFDEWDSMSLTDKINRNLNIAKQYIASSPSIGNVYNAVSALFGGYDPQNPYLITGTAPSIGKGSIKKQSVSKANDKGLQVTKKVDTAVRHALSYIDGDTRHIRSGRSRVITARRDRAKQFIVQNKTPEYKQLLQLSKKEAKYADDKVMQSKIKKQINDLLDNVIESGLIR